MTVKQLIQQLQALPQTAQVVVVTRSGADPNASPLDAVQADRYRVHSTWAGHVVHEDDVEPSDKRVVALWPVR